MAGPATKLCAAVLAATTRPCDAMPRPHRAGQELATAFHEAEATHAERRGQPATTGPAFLHLAEAVAAA